MLTRLRISQRLSLLVLLPIVALVVAGLPATVRQVDEARAAAAIVSAARAAHIVQEVIGDLQQERLLGLAYVATPRTERAVLVAQIFTTSAALRDARAQLGSGSEQLSKALDLAMAVSDQRDRLLARGLSADAIYRGYTGAIDALIYALRLGDQPGADATGLRQLTTLGALLRRDEENAKIGAALVLAVSDEPRARMVVTVATPLAAAHQQILDVSGDDTVDGALRSAGAKRVDELARDLAAGGSRGGDRLIDVSLGAATASLHAHLVTGARITSDIVGRAQARAIQARATAIAVAAIALALTALLVWLGVAIGRSVARPLRRITLAATAVADLAAREMARVADADSDDQGPPRLAAVTIRTADEVGELASAFNRVQATAALLMEQQVTSRRNVGVMFANIANRTRSLVARQLSDIDQLERDERDDDKLAKLYHLDHLTTRLRRSSDSLLVIANADQESADAAPAPLAEIVRSATAEVEGFQNARFGTIVDVVVVAAAVSDLTLLLAELLENALSFSPPETPVYVTAELADNLIIRIVDHGIGLSADRLAAENRRLVTRERLDLMPTAMLGLVVVGRIARRHKLVVRLLPTPGTGVTVEVVVPTDLLLGPAARRAVTERRPMSVPAALPAGPPPAPADARIGPMRSVAQPRGAAHPASRAGSEAASLGPPSRRTPRHAAPDGGLEGPPFAAGRPPLAREAPPAGPVRASAEVRGGLQRRRPGTNLDASIGPEPRRTVPDAASAGHAARIRDAAAERSQLAGYLDGLSRAARTSANNDRDGSH